MGKAHPKRCMAKIEFVKTDVLHLAYEESGPRKGVPVFLAHGWPDSPRGWDNVLPALHQAGFRTIVPYLRGFAPTRFRTHLFGRNPKHTGQRVSFAQDMIDLAEALKLKTFHFVGHDWGAQAGYGLSALFAHRLRSLTAISVNFAPGDLEPPKFAQAQAFWYKFYFCTKPGTEGFVQDPIGFARYIWQTWSPGKWFTEGEFASAAKSFEGDEFIDVTLHAYRVRWGHAAIDDRYDVLQDRYDATPSLPTPTLLIQGLEDQCLLAETTDGMGRYFTGGYRRALLEEVGHFPPREAPDQVAKLIVEHVQQNEGAR